MFIVHVHVHVKPEFVEAFKEATVENASNSVQEPGIARFDVVQQQNDPNRFILVEVYRTDADPARHKETAHYAKWRDTVVGPAATRGMMRKWLSRAVVSSTTTFIPTTRGGGKGITDSAARESRLQSCRRSKWLTPAVKPVLVEVFRTTADPGKHKETAHYAKWRDTVAEMMAEPRSSVKYDNVFPGEDGWG